jgi:hypothetical protein
MRWIPGIPAALILFIPIAAFAQDRGPQGASVRPGVENRVEDWARFVSPGMGSARTIPASRT